MARKAAVTAQQPPPPQPVASIDPTVPTEQREITKYEEQVSRFTLDDGSVLLIRPLLADVKRAKNRFSDDGNPLYYMKIGVVVTSRSPAKLRRKAPKKAKKS